MNKITYLILVFFCAFNFQSCQDDDISSDNPTYQSSEVKDAVFKTKNFGDATTANFIGTITNEKGSKLSSVQITIGNTTLTTDHNGVFIVNNVDVFENFAYIKAQKEGYIQGSRVVIPKTEGVNNIKIVLLKKDVTASVTAGETSQAALPNGATVNFDGEFITATGDDYSGQVDVVMHYIAPNTKDTFTQMPGNLFAQNTSNDARSLETYGMLSVNLYAPSGEQLNVTESSPATITFPIDDSQIAIAPDTINLWYFDEEQGYWKEQGQAVKQGNTYIGEVNHFTWWNVDLPLDFVNFCFTLSQETTGAEVSTTVSYVEIKRKSNDQTIFGGMVYSGRGLEPECGIIPKNEEITVSIYSASGICDRILLHEAVFGPYSIDTAVNISVPEVATTSTTVITGTVTNCLGNPITSGYIFVDEHNIISIANGIINYSLQHCTEETKDIIVFDLDSNKFSNEYSAPLTINLNGASLDLGALSTCETIGGVYEGDVDLTSQAEVNVFGLFGYTSINGFLVVGIKNETTDIIDLSPLSTLVSVSGYVFIQDTQNLRSVNLDAMETIGGGLGIDRNQNLTALSLNSLSVINTGFAFRENEKMTSIGEFNSLTSIKGHVNIHNNPSLRSLEGLSSLISVNWALNIYSNDNLLTLAGLDALKSIIDPGVGSSILYICDNKSLTSINLNGLSNVYDLDIKNNPALTSIGLDSFTNLDNLHIENNDALPNLLGFTNLTTISEKLLVKDNDSLINFTGFDNLTTLSKVYIASNAQLTSLKGLDNVTAVYSFYLGDYGWDSVNDGPKGGPNPNLTDLCAVQNLFVNGNGASANVRIQGNAYNPTIQDIMDGNCSQ